MLGIPAGNRLALALPHLVPILRAFGELDIDDVTAPLLVGMSAATMDRRWHPKTQEARPTRPLAHQTRHLVKTKIPIRTWAQWDDVVCQMLARVSLDDAYAQRVISLLELIEELDAYEARFTARIATELRGDRGYRRSRR